MAQCKAKSITPTPQKHYSVGMKSDGPYLDNEKRALKRNCWIKEESSGNKARFYAIWPALEPLKTWVLHKISNISHGCLSKKTREIIDHPLKAQYMCSWGEGVCFPQLRNLCLSLIIYLAVCLSAAEGESSEKHANVSQLALQTPDIPPWSPL